MRRAPRRCRRPPYSRESLAVPITSSTVANLQRTTWPPQWASRVASLARSRRWPPTPIHRRRASRPHTSRRPVRRRESRWGTSYWRTNPALGRGLLDDARIIDALDGGDSLAKRRRRRTERAMTALRVPPRTSSHVSARPHDRGHPWMTARPCGAPTSPSSVGVPVATKDGPDRPSTPWAMSRPVPRCRATPRRTSTVTHGVRAAPRRESCSAVSHTATSAPVGADGSRLRPPAALVTAHRCRGAPAGQVARAASSSASRSATVREAGRAPEWAMRLATRASMALTGVATP